MKLVSVEFDSFVAAARVKNYAGDPNEPLNGKLVQVEWFDYESDFFECTLVDYKVPVNVLLCKTDELEPVNEFTKELLAVMPESCGPTEGIVSLRKMLLKARKDVPHEVLKSWTELQRAAAKAWALVASLPLRTDRPDPVVPPMPGVLTKF